MPATMPAENVTIIAVFSANIYNAVFDANGGVWSDGSTEKTVSASFDSEIIAPENPERTGYVFSKWSPEVGTMDDVNGKTFTAEWIASTDTVYTVEIYTMNTAGEYEKSVQTLNGTTDSTVNAEYNVEEGFTFNSKKSIISGVVSADNSLVLKVYIDRNTYTFTTIVDGVSNSTQYLYGSIIPEIIPKKTGYSFIGWDKQVPSTMPAENVTITAVFEVNSYDAVFNANGGSWSDGSTEKTVSTVYGSEIVVPENPERRGYTFDGWDIDIPSVMPAENVVAEAIWTVNTYELTWVVDGVSTKNNIVFGNTITVPENPEKTG